MYAESARNQSEYALKRRLILSERSESLLVAYAPTNVPTIALNRLFHQSSIAPHSTAWPGHGCLRGCVARVGAGPARDSPGVPSRPVIVKRARGARYAGAADIPGGTHSQEPQPVERDPIGDAALRYSS
jgi:hypothetical protein